MAIVLGTDAGFVTVAPTRDLSGETSSTQDGHARCTKHTCPAAVDKITEIGWHFDKGPVGQNYEVGLYSHDVGGDTADALLYSDTTNTVGGGWNVVSGLSWAVTPTTVYWIAVQVDGVGGSTEINYDATGGRTGLNTYEASLPDPFSSVVDNANILAIYAKVELVSDENAEGTKTVTVAASVELASENYVNRQGPVPPRPTGPDPSECWDEDTQTWSAANCVTNVRHPGHWIQNVLTISEEGEIYFRTI